MTAEETIARAIHDNDRAYSPPYWDDCDDTMKRWYREMATKALEALSAEGFALYRPEDCERIVLGLCRREDRCSGAVMTEILAGDAEPGEYRLVPVEVAP